MILSRAALRDTTWTERKAIKEGTRHILMIAVGACDNEMNNKLVEYLLSDPDKTFHEISQKNSGTQETREHLEAGDKTHFHCLHTKSNFKNLCQSRTWL